LDVTTRLDKWLWAARFFKTRALAQKAIEAGRVSINGVRAKAAKDTHIDDVLDIAIGANRWVVRVRRISDIRGPAGIAQTLYPEPARQAGRPTKRDRRALARVAGKAVL
jgi:ribosome-associated heat shock protein Hsp15